MLPRRTGLLTSPLLCIAVVVFFFLVLNRVTSGHDPPSPTRADETRSQAVFSDISGRVNPPLHTRGRHIVDSANNTVQLTSVNWYGASDILFIPPGLDIQPRDRIAALIRNIGFNSVRLPYSDEMVAKNPVVDPSLLAANLDLVEAAGGVVRALDVFTAVVDSLTAAGLMVIVNDHITQAAWCCGANPCDGSWANDWFGGKLFCPVSQSLEQWIANWETIMAPLVGNKLMIGADLRNEWWAAAAAENAAERLLAMDPKWLMRPVQLSIPGRVVYSAHVYCWSGWGSLRPFAYRDYDSFAATMRANWAYLVLEDIAPVWVGDVGAPNKPSKGDLNYWAHLVRYMKEADTGWGYWAVNPRKPEESAPETYGLVEDDWQTVRWDYRLEDLKELGLNPSL